MPKIEEIDDSELQRGFGKHAISALIGSVGAKAIGLILVKILTILLSKSEFGVYSLWLSLSVLVATFSYGAFSAALWRFLPRQRFTNKSGASRLIIGAVTGSLTSIITIYSALIISFMFTGFVVYPDHDYLFLVFSVFLLSVAFTGVEITLVISGTEQNSRDIILFNLAYYGISTTLAIVGAVTGQEHGFVLLFLAIGYLVPVGITFAYKINRYGIYRPTIQDITNMLRFGLPSVAISTVITLQPFIEGYFVAIFIGTEQIGSMTIALSIATLFSFLISPPLTAYQSYLINSYETNNFTSRENVTSLIVRIFLIMSAIFGWGIVIFAPILINLLSTAQYLDAVELIPYATAASIMTALSFIPKVRIDIVEKTHITGISYVLSLVMLIGTSIALVPTWGLTGVGIALVLQALTVLSLIWFFGSKSIPIVIPKSFFAKWLLALAYLIVSIQFAHIFGSLTTMVLVSIGVYVAIILITRAMTIQEIRKILGFLLKL